MSRFKSNKLIVFIPGYLGDPDDLWFLADEIRNNFIPEVLLIDYSKIEICLNIRNANAYIEKTIYNKLMTRNYKSVYLIGYSLGAALALNFAIKNQFLCKGLILISIFDDRKNLLEEKDIQISENENITPVKLVGKLMTIPIVFIHGINDKSIPIIRAKSVYINTDRNLSRFYAIPTGHNFVKKSEQEFLSSKVVKSLNNFGIE